MNTSLSSLYIVYTRVKILTFNNIYIHSIPKRLFTPGIPSAIHSTICNIHIKREVELNEYLTSD